jgi:voltage-gated potassium channel
MQIKRKWRQFINFLQREKLDRLMGLILALIIGSAIALSLVEKDLSLADSLWWSIVTLTTVGYGDISPATPVGRLIAILNMVVGVGLLAMLSATLASFLVNLKLKENRGMSEYAFKGHIILCEWNSRTAAVIKELRLTPQTEFTPIVLIANLEHNPCRAERVYFISGNVNDDTLTRANIKDAATVLILGDDHLDDIARDAKVILSTLTVESLNQRVYTVVELVDETHVITCQRANANEIVVGNEITSRLMSQAVLNHGMSKVVSQLLTAENDNQLYKIPVPKFKVGKPFLEVLVYMKEQYQATVVALQSGGNGEVISNPPNDLYVNADDALIVIAQHHPQF